MHGSTPVTWQLRGEVNPALSHMICNAPFAGDVAVPQVAVSLRDAVQRELFVRPRRQVEITDTSG